MIAVVGGLMASRRSFGGDLAFRAANILLSSLVVVGLALAVVSIKRLQIEQHRAWMLRTWFWVSKSRRKKNQKTNETKKAIPWAIVIPSQ